MNMFIKYSPGTPPVYPSQCQAYFQYTFKSGIPSALIGIDCDFLISSLALRVFYSFITKKDAPATLNAIAVVRKPAATFSPVVISGMLGM